MLTGDESTWCSRESHKYTSYESYEGRSGTTKFIRLTAFGLGEMYIWFKWILLGTGHRESSEPLKYEVDTLYQ